MEQIAAEVRILGRIQSTFDIDKKYVFVTNVDTKYTPKITCYCLATGKSMELKVQKKIFEQKQISTNTILFCKEFEKKHGGRFEFSEDGEKKWVEDPNTVVWWLKNYDRGDLK